MKIINDLASLAQLQRERAHPLALVPTMGNLHRGHMSLVREAQGQAAQVAVSIYVNHTQFGDNEDFGSYPRTLDADQRLLEEAGVDYLFLPDQPLIYPQGLEQMFSFRLPRQFTDILCGARRPGHFDGVINVVARLFNLIRPELAFFGLKDYQQQWLIRRFVADLHWPVQIHGVALVRDGDGLALSSRNGYLNDRERALAPEIYQSLCRTHQALLNGRNIIAAEIDELKSLGFTVEYYELRSQQTLELTDDLNDARLFIAVRLGQTRLIDNLAI